ncbi:MAG: DUF2779 domain-containing protein [Candidatus Pacearchaeota archaeon]
MKLLSKSKYLIGLQCPRYLWTTIHEPEKIPETDEATQNKFEQGYLVGELAKKWFTEGIDIETKDFIKNINESLELLKKRKPLFEAGIIVKLDWGDIYSRADILNPVGKDEWDIIEVKSGTRVKPENICDVGFQKCVYEKSGLKIRKCFLMHVNNEYVKNGTINPKEILKTQDITNEVNEEIKGIEDRIKNLFRIINAKKCPNLSIGQHCKNPYDCPISECWDFLPSENVFELYYGGKKCFELFEKDIQSLKDIPDQFKLSRKQQQIQIECAREGKIYLDKANIKSFLKKLKYPLYYLDFETISTAVPIFDGSHPYQQIPFQYSLHIVEKENGKPKHISFLAKGDKDPRREFLKSLIENLGDNGNILVYNESFEKSVLEKLSSLFPKEKKDIEDIKKRIIDLLEPFKEFDYYNPKQKGSASIKKVLPALVEKLPKGMKGYTEMEIGKGDEASLAFLKIALGEHDDYIDWDKVSEEEQRKIRKHLEEYCKLDTYAEVLILDRLRELVK